MTGIYLIVVGIFLYLSHKFESKINYKFIAWALMLIKNSVVVFDFNYTNMLEKSEVVLLVFTHIICMTIFAFVSLLLLPDSKALRLVNFTCGSILLIGTMHNLDHLEGWQDLKSRAVLIVGQLIYYVIIGHILISARTLLIELIIKNKNEHTQLAIILNNLRESVIIIHENNLNFANDTFLFKFSNQIASSKVLDNPENPEANHNPIR